MIAESTHKTDKLDAQVLAEFLAAGHDSRRPIVPRRGSASIGPWSASGSTSSGGSPRPRTSLRHILAHYNADVKYLFTAEGQAYLAELKLSAADRFVADQLLRRADSTSGQQLAEIHRRAAKFAKKRPLAEQEARQVLASIPCVGPVTIDVVLAELGDVRRFRSQKQVAAYAGLAPGVRESADRTQATAASPRKARGCCGGC